jgi:hypothetical protein
MHTGTLAEWVRWLRFFAKLFHPLINISGQPRVDYLRSGALGQRINPWLGASRVRDAIAFTLFLFHSPWEWLAVDVCSSLPSPLSKTRDANLPSLLYIPVFFGYPLFA